MGGVGLTCLDFLGLHGRLSNGKQPSTALGGRVVGENARQRQSEASATREVCYQKCLFDSWKAPRKIQR